MPLWYELPSAITEVHFFHSTSHDVCQHTQAVPKTQENIKFCMTYMIALPAAAVLARVGGTGCRIVVNGTINIFHFPVAADPRYNKALTETGGIASLAELPEESQ